jgi:hypothetical protein
MDYSVSPLAPRITFLLAIALETLSDWDQVGLPGRGVTPTWILMLTLHTGNFLMMSLEAMVLTSRAT